MSNSTDPSSETISKTKSSFYRRLLVAFLIDEKVNTVPSIMAHTQMPRRTAQDTITALNELDIVCEFIGAKKDGGYEIQDWGAINKKWLRANIESIKEALGYEC